VGCGWISERHAGAAAASAEVEIVACCDIDAGVAEDWSRRHGCERAYDDYLAMVREHELDAVVIATWPNLHHEQVLTCLEVGVRSVLCEKALTLTGAQALEIKAAAEASGALVVEAYMYRHHPAIRTIDELLAREEIGPLDSVSAAFDMFDPEKASPDDAGRDWRQHRERAGGVPYDIACYCVDACNRFAGAVPQRVHAVGGTSERYGTVDRLYGLIEYANGLVGIIRSSRRSDFDHELMLAGPRGHVRLPVAWRIETSTEVLVTRSGRWAEFETSPFPIPATDPFRLQLEAFAAAVRGEGPPTPTLTESVVNALTMDALLAAASERTATRVELPEGLST
jgi:predicted dehydrogenase